jgi:hypothetical protein
MMATMMVVAMVMILIKGVSFIHGRSGCVSMGTTKRVMTSKMLKMSMGVVLR